MRRGQAWTLALLAAACAFVAQVGPSAAFDFAELDRTATATVTTDAAGYNALSTTTSWTCTGAPLSTTQCTVGLVTNKGSTGQTYRLMKETETASKVRDWSLGGVAAVTSSSVSSGGSPWTSWTAEKSIGQSTAIIVNVSSCTLGCSRSFYNFTVEGQKANIIDFNETRIMVIVEY